MELGPAMKARLARSGHLSSVIGHLMVVSGGILRDGSLCMDLVVLNLSTLTFIKSVSRDDSSCMQSCCCCSSPACTCWALFNRSVLYNPFATLYALLCRHRSQHQLHDPIAQAHASPSTIVSLPHHLDGLKTSRVH